MSNLRRELIEESWSDEEDNVHSECEICQKVETSSEVHSEIEHFCYDPFIIEFSKLENEFKHLYNIFQKTFSENESLKSFESNFEKEIILEDKISRLESGIKIDLEYKVCQDYKSEIKEVNERANILAKFEKSSQSLKKFT